MAKNRVSSKQRLDIIREAFRVFELTNKSRQDFMKLIDEVADALRADLQPRSLDERENADGN